MKVHDVMTPDVILVGPDATLAEAGRLVQEGDIGPFPVCESGVVLGMVTDRDIAVRSAADGRDPKTTRVREVVTPYVVCCFETDEVEEAARLMREAQLQRLLVIDDDRHLVGRVSLADIAPQTADDRGGANRKRYSTN